MVTLKKVQQIIYNYGPWKRWISKIVNQRWGYFPEGFSPREITPARLTILIFTDFKGRNCFIIPNKQWTGISYAVYLCFYHVYVETCYVHCISRVIHRWIIGLFNGHGFLKRLFNFCTNLKKNTQIISRHVTLFHPIKSITNSVRYNNIS